MPVVASMKPSDTDASVQRTDSQRSQSNGPRVSFNKDVHVKKIGRRLSDPLEVSYHPNIRRELPSDLSDKALRKEAALVLSQADKAKNGQHITLTRTSSDPKRRKEDKSSRFGSLPSRSKALGRSASDASSKKSKRPSIFNFFALKKNEYNLDEEEKKTESNNNSTLVNNNKRVTRSKSDVGSGGITRHDFRRSPRRKNDETEETSMLKKNPQLSPIIEDTNRDDYFEEKETVKGSKKERASEPRKIETKTYFGGLKPRESASPTKKFKEEKPQIDKSVEQDFADAVEAFNQPGKSVSPFTESLENMHSSQLPPEKPPLTKGMKVPSMVKRLSMEKLSPPPSGVKAFSYLSPRTSPVDDDRKIVYAEVICTKNDDGKRNNIKTNTATENKRENNKFYKSNDTNEPDSHYKSKPYNLYQNTQHYTNGLSKYYDDDDFDLKPNKQTPAERFAAKYKTALSYSSENLLKEVDDDDVDRIKPSIRNLPPEKPPVNPWELGRRGQADGKEYYPEFNELSNRREELYSRIKSRINSNVRETNVTQTNITSSNGYTTNNLNQTQVRRNLSKEFLNVDNDEPDNVHTNIGTGRHLSDQKYGAVNGKSYKTHTETHRTETKTNRYILDDSNDDSSAINRYTVTRSPLREPSPKREILGSNSREKHFTSNVVKKDKMEVVSDSHSKSKPKPEVKEHKTTSFTNSLGRKKKQTFTNGTSLPISNEKLIHVTEKFLKKERRHTDESTRSQYLHRERSIDDGSKFDPRIDKYEVGTIERKQRSQTIDDKADKRFGSLGRMKQLLMGNGNKKPKKNNENLVPNSQELLVSDEEMRSRYREYRGPSTGYEKENVIEVQEIANRRRLSTPRSSPIVHRNLTRNDSDEPKQQIKTSWFKSLDRLSRKKNASKENLDVVKRDRSVSPYKRSKSPGKQKLRFFGDSDIESSVSKGKTTPRTRKSTPFTLTKSNKVYSKSAFNLNANGSSDKKSDNEYNNRSASLYDLDKTTDRKLRQRERISRSRELHNISEDISTSENEHHTLKNHKNGSDLKYKQKRGHSSSSERAVPLKSDYSRTRQHHSVDSYDEDSTRYLSHERRTNSRDVSRERQSMSPLRYSYEQEVAPKGSGDYRKPPLGPPKPARSFMRQKEMERIQDSSGTEGELSQHSVVYLHATTVGDIPPQTYIPPSRSASKSASRSRDDLSYSTDRTDGKIEPMTKTVSRSISMLAPWRPKHVSEGYEIDYSKRQTRKYVVPSQSATSTLPKQHKSGGGISSKNKSRTSNGFDRKYPTVDRKHRDQNEFDTTYRSGFDIDHHHYRDSPVGGYNHSKVMI